MPQIVAEIKRTESKNKLTARQRKTNDGCLTLFHSGGGGGGLLSSQR